VIDNPLNPLQEPVREALRTSVLVIEEDASLQNLLRTVLRINGFAVECFSDAAAGLAHLDSAPVDVIVVDVTRAGGNDPSMIKRLSARQDDSWQRTIVTTGLGPAQLCPGDCEEAFALLRKPYDIEDLVATVSRCASRTSARHGRRNRAKRKRERALGDERDGVSPGVAGLTERVASAAAGLRAIFTSRPLSPEETMLRGELRRDLIRLGRLIEEAALMEADDHHAVSLRGAARAAQIVASRTPRRARS
jgi:FixJ family two-component response regulator